MYFYEWKRKDVLNVNKYGILEKKEFYNKENMKKITFAKKITENEIRKENFVYTVFNINNTSTYNIAISIWKISILLGT